MSARRIEVCTCLLALLSACNCPGPLPRVPDGCVLTTCSAEQAECGEIESCGATLNCGSCPPRFQCSSHRCVLSCTPRTCAQLGNSCGSSDDGCGGTIDCTCSLPMTCGGAGTTGQCGCTPRSCADAGVECGSFDDGCGNLQECGVCGAPDSCGGGGAPGRCGCTPRTCAQLAASDAGIECGFTDDSCGGRMNCGTCPSGAVCGAGANPNGCAPPRTCTEKWCIEYPWPLTWVEQIHGTSLQDLWVSGAGNTFRWNGTTWYRPATTPPALSSIWAASPFDAWGAGDAIYRWNGTVWTVVPHPSSPALSGFTQVRGASADSVWFSGTGNFVLRWQPHGWSAWRLGLGGLLSGTGPLWPTTNDDVWVSMFGEPLQRWTGQAWAKQLPPNAADDIWASGPDDAWMVADSEVNRWNGKTWTSLSSWPSSYHHVTGTSQANVWLVGNGLTHWDGTNLSHVPLAPTTGAFTAAWAASPVALVLGTSRGEVLVRHADGGFDSLAEGGDTRKLSDLWGMGAKERWAVGNAGLVLRWNGTDWRKVSVPTTNDLIAVWGSGPDSVWIAGQGLVLHWDGLAWTTHPHGRSVRALWGSGANEVWAFADDAFLHWDGATWSSTPSPLVRPSGVSPSVLAAWGSADNDIWAVGTEGAMVHWNGTNWAEVAQSLTPSNLIAISGTGPSNIEAISSQQVLHFNGTSWSLGAAPTNDLTGLWFDAMGVRWLSNTSTIYQKDSLGERAGPPSSHGISRLRGWANEIHVIGTQSILEYQP